MMTATAIGATQTGMSPSQEATNFPEVLRHSRQNRPACPTRLPTREPRCIKG